MLLRGATLVNPGGESGELDVLIVGGRIERLGRNLPANGNCVIRNVTGRLIFPAFIDIHVHLREPGQTHKEDVASGSRAALKGGFTAIAAMPNTQPVIDTPDLVSWLISQGKASSMEIYPVAAISRGLQGHALTDMKALVDAGAVGFTDDGMTLADSSLMRDALKQSEALSVAIFQHSEDPQLSRNGQVDPRAVSLFDFPVTPLSPSAEDVVVARDIALQNDVGGHLHVTHLSTGFAGDLVSWAKERGQRVSADVTPHHLLLNYHHLTRSGSLAKMKPPLRSETDRLHLIDLLEDGVIDCIATDHAPHSRDEKARPFVDTPFGIIGLETAFPLLYDRLVRNGKLTLRRLVELFTTAPARLIHQHHRLGVLAPGLPANLVVFNAERPFKIEPDYFFSKSCNSPFIGWEGFGVVEETHVAGQVRYQAL